MMYIRRDNEDQQVTELEPAETVDSSEPSLTDRRQIDVTETDHDEGLSKLQQIIYLLAGILNGIVIIRFALLLFGANPLNSFANFVYSITNPLIAPFRGLFGFQMNVGRSHLEIESLIAIMVYSLAAYAIVKIIGLSKRHAETY